MSLTTGALILFPTTFAIGVHARNDTPRKKKYCGVNVFKIARFSILPDAAPNIHFKYSRPAPRLSALKNTQPIITTNKA